MEENVPLEPTYRVSVDGRRLTGEVLLTKLTEVEQLDKLPPADVRLARSGD